MILMYHHVAPAEAIPSAPSPDEGWQYTISPSMLEYQLSSLMKRGFKFITLEEMVTNICAKGYAPSHTAAITLDDGWADNYEHAFPLFQRLGLTATFFVTTNHLRSGIPDTRKMTGAQLREILQHGMSIGGHSRSHPNLTKISLENARDEIVGCKQDLEQTLGTTIEYFAYPGGAFNRSVANVVLEAGFRAACSVIGLGINLRSSMFWLHRDVLTDEMNTLGDRLRFSTAARLLLWPRTWHRLHKQLGTG